MHEKLLLLVVIGLFLITLIGVIAFFSVEHFQNGFSFETHHGSPFIEKTPLIRIGSIRSKRHPIEIEQSYNWYNNP
jgi:hypothetical protein